MFSWRNEKNVSIFVQKRCLIKANFKNLLNIYIISFEIKMREYQTFQVFRTLNKNGVDTKGVWGSEAQGEERNGEM